MCLPFLHLAAPLSGWYADRGGTVASTLACAICAAPFYILIFIKGPLAYFLVMFAVLSECTRPCRSRNHS